MNSKQEGRYLSLGVLLALVILVFVLSIFRIENYDIWWHLRTGQHIVTARQIPHDDLFSFVTAGRKWVNPSWLADVMLFVTNNIFGLGGLVILKATVLAGTFGLLFLTMKREGAPAWVGGMLLSLAALVGVSRFMVRPEMFTFLFTALLLFLIALDRNGRSWALYLVPPLMLIWANLHAGCVGGLLIMLAYFAERRQKQIAFVTLLAIAAVLINPYSYEILLYPMRLMSMRFVRQIREWMPPDFSPEFWPFWCMIFLAAIVMVTRIRELRLMEAIVMAVFMSLAVTSRRNTAMFALVCGPCLARHLAAPARRLSLRPLLSAFATGALILLAACVGTIWGSHTFGIGVKQGLFPEKALRFMDENGISGNIYNEYQWGGYIIYRRFPAQKVFIDGRCLVYGPALYQEWRDIYYTRAGWDDLLKKTNVKVLLLDYNRPDRRQGMAALNSMDVQPFYENRSWRVIFWDELSMVCVRDEKENRSLIKKYLCEVSNPGTIHAVISTGRGLARAISELNRKIADDPTCYVAYDLLGQCFIRMGQLDNATAALQMCLQLQPRYAPAHYHMGVCHYRRGQYELAVTSYRTAISLTANYAPYYHNLGDAYLAMGMFRAAEWAYKKAMKSNAALWLTWKNLGICYERMGRYHDAVKHLEIANQMVGGDTEITETIKRVKNLSRTQQDDG